MGLSRKSVIARAVEALVFGGLFWVLSSWSLALVGGIVGGVFLLGVTSDALESYVGDYAGNVLFGVLLLGAGVAVAVLRGRVLLGVVGVLVGAWFVFDGVQHLRHGVERTRSTRNVASAYSDTKHVARVRAALKDGPRTRDELASDLDVSTDELTPSLRYLESTHRVEQTADGYQLNADYSTTGSVLGMPSRFFDRVLEPFRL